MAVRQRIFNSTAPFCGSSPAELKGSYPECSATEQETQEEEEEGEEQGKSCKLDFMACLNPIINKVLTQGSAEQVGEMPLKNSPFIAQASWNYSETLDSICPSGSSERPFVSKRFPISLPSEHNNVACPTTASIQEPAEGAPAPQTPQKKTRKRPKRKTKKKAEGKQQRQRVPSGVPEQESGSSLIQIQKPSHLQEDSPFELSSGVDASAETSGPVYDYGRAPSGWSHAPRGPHPYSQDSDSQDSDSLSNGGSNFSLALCALRGNVSQAEPCYAAPFCKDVERDARDDDGEDLSDSASFCNEGIIFCNDKIQPVDSEYKEGREYVTDFVKQGSFGVVYQAQDVNTGFTFAVKKIPLKSFTSEEVGTWSALRSPHVLELFGVVREGPNILLLMDHKSGSLGQLIAERGRLPEDLSLRYMQQVTAALEHLLKKKVAHLDVKADNVLLSKDGRDTFLCDFGHAERLDNQGLSLSGSKDLKGTETHMAPEMVKGEPRGAKADVWSSCCMLLHMLNGCQPWTRYYTCFLFLKIANEPPPLREIPPDCGPLTAEVIRAGLHKDPSKRASASQIRERATRALKEVEGLNSPVKGPYTQPLYIANKPPDGGNSSSQEEEEEEQHGRSVERLMMAGRSVKELEEDEDEEAESKRGTPLCLRDFNSEPNHKAGSSVSELKLPELELRKLERDFYLSSLSQLHSAEMQEQLLSCLSSDAYSSREPWDKKDSGRWSLSPGEFSSGVCSYNSQTDGTDLSVELLAHTQPPRPCCFEGVDVCIRDFNRRSIRIRETRRVKVGHIATGISDQISERVFTLETQQGQQVAHDEEVQESGLKLCCVPAPDFSPAWRWRVRDGLLETR